MINIHSISFKFSGWMLGASLLFLILITTLTSQLISEQYESIEQGKLEAIVENITPTLSLNISYDFDKATEEMAENLYKNPLILFVSIRNVEKEIVTRSQDKKTFSEYKNLKHFTLEKKLSDPLSSSTIGTITLVYSRTLFDQMMSRYYQQLTLVISFYLLFLALMGFLLHRATLPLSHLAKQMLSFDPVNPKHFDFDTHDKSEISLIAMASNTMIESIRSYLVKLDTLKHNLIQRETHLNDAQKMAHVGSWEYNTETKHFEMSQELLRIFGINSRNHKPHWETFLDYTVKENRAYLHATLDEAIIKGSRFNLQYRCYKMNGDIVDIHTQGKVRKKNDAATKITGVSMDVTEQHHAQQMIEKLAYYDSLTHLPNRVLFKDRLDKAISASKRNNDLIGVLFIDLDHFKMINDSLGHLVGDELLKYIANTLVDSLRKKDTVSRLGGDEFTIMIPSIDSIDDLKHISKKLLSNLNKRLSIGKHELYISMSIGIACYPDHGLNTDELLKNSDTAMYKAKELGRNNFQVYQTQMGSHLTKQLGLEQEFRKAVSTQDRGLKLYYQPKIDFKSLKITGAEALIRWEHPTQGLLFPDSFIPLAESTGLILDLGTWIIEEGIQQALRWEKQCKAPIQISINLSARQFQDANLVPQISALIEKYPINPALLEFEITESISMNNIAENLIVMGELKALGVALAIDDFGTGYSSLSYLKQFPVDTLKIDKSFVMDMLDDNDDKVIVSTIISMAKALGLKTVAEGVETEEHQELLQELECNTAQGYLYAKALEEKAFLEFAAKHI
ncbi:MAG: EAL domain-containing protein [Campylobacterota bacterium]|nr:EAL domain-containing protein [Campylobacterota bacterium]